MLGRSAHVTDASGKIAGLGRPFLVSIGVCLRGYTLPNPRLDTSYRTFQLIEVISDEAGQARKPRDKLVELIEVDHEFVAHGRLRLDVCAALSVS